MLFRCERVRETKGRCFDHTVCNSRRAGEDCAQTYTGEDIHVITLSRVQRLAIELLFWEWRARGKDNLAVGPLNRFVELALGETNGVREREDDGARVIRGHTLDDGLVEGTLDRRQTEDSSWLDIVDYIHQVRNGFASVVLTREVWRELC